MNCLLFLAGLLALTFADHDIKYVKKYSTTEFKDAVTKNPHFVLFYAPWCGHCKRTMPAYEELSEKYNENEGSKQATIAMIDCTQHTDICSEQGVNGYPTIKYFEPSSSEGDEYFGGRGFSDFDQYIQAKLGDTGATEKPAENQNIETSNGVKLYTNDNFDAAIQTGHHFVKFFAPWCPHCKNMVKDWEQLAGLYEDRSVSVAEVDCTQHQAICGSNEIKGYPTLLFFSNGRMVEKYSGARNIDAFKEFVAKTTNSEIKASESQEETVPAEVTNVKVYTTKNFAETNTGHHFVKFYAPWCPHCQNIAPAWEKLGEAFNDDDTVTIGKVDCTTDSEACKKPEVSGYPTLWWMTDGKYVEKYSGPRDFEDLKEFVNSMRGKKDDAKHGTVEDKKVEYVQTLTVDTFEDSISEGHYFIKFYAPWCGHCKRMAPAWEELGKKFAGHEIISIAEVDCTKNREICDKHEVTGFPTLYYFENGQRISEHNGGRDLEELVKFVQDKLPHDEL
ncbi:DgyrCDS4769 [Dimorphilus gyrociliatus]|uniref:DgyrCDS4769 n=1 Tax=Dimorphilus gyrociliatus TaxID=2664684 RepID=A0A7I8VHR3_9ANNE|nr:DgyrCDS4769 [Dimorphilus gyrociliatus]